MRLNERQENFIRYLRSLAEKEDRGALADLRSGLGRTPGEMARVHKHVMWCEPEKYNERWYYLVATLFGVFPNHREGPSWGSPSLGEAFRRIKKSDSMGARFVALLNAHPDDLGDHLRHVISLLKSNEPPQPVNWFGLFRDLLEWDRSDGCVQLHWARDFYRPDPQPNSDKPDSDSTPKEEDQDDE
jgi:CRISPR system Cascade subunit CasB